jgi:hypothetical protein
VSVDGDAQNIRIGTHSASDGFMGQIHVGHDLFGLLEVVGGGVNNPGPLEAIVIDEDVTGQILIQTALHRNLVVTGSVAQGATVTLEAPVDPAALIQLGSLAGSLFIQDSGGAFAEIAGAIEQTGLVRATAGITETGLLSIAAGSGISGEVSIDQAFLGELELDAQIAEDGVIEIAGEVAADARVWVGSNFLGTFHATSDYPGALEIDGMVGPAGLILIDGEMPYPSLLEVGSHFRGTLEIEALAGYVHIGADMSGLIDVLYCIGDSDPSHPFAGHIRVNGGFRPHPGGPAPRIEAFDMGSPRSYITFDYDCSGDPWASGAQVVFYADPFPYTHNTPSARVWHCVHCFADMNNDGSINSADGTPLGTGPFFLALNDPPQYALNFAGLGEANPDWNPNDPEAVPRFLSGPVLFHGNCNCDQFFNWDDEPDFLDLVSSHACVNGCAGRGELSRMAPDALATEIVANVDPEILPDAPALMEETIALYPDQPEAQEYWQTVQAGACPPAKSEPHARAWSFRPAVRRPSAPRCPRSARRLDRPIAPARGAPRGVHGAAETRPGCGPGPAPQADWSPARS